MQSFLTSVMTSHGYLALIIFGFIEAACIPISSEVTFAFAGVIAAIPHSGFSLVGVVIIGTLAEMAGSLFSYAIGRRGGRSLLERYGKWVLVTHADLDRAERFFANRGSWAVAIGRAMPVIRTFASFAAGVVEVPAIPFTIYSLIGTVAWTIGLSQLGYHLGPAVTKFFHSFSIIGIGLVVLFLAALVAHRIHALRKESADRNLAAAAGARPQARERPVSRTGGAHRGGRGR